MISLRTYSQKLARLPRFTKQLILVSSDFIILLLSAYLAFVLRLGFVFTPSLAQVALMLTAPMLAVPLFIRFGLYRAIIRYLPERAIWPIFQATAIASLFWVALIYLTEMTGGRGVPRSIPLLYWLLSTVLVTLSRFSAKWLLQSAQGVHNYTSSALIVGTGEAARQLAMALRSHSNTRVIGFVDVNPAVIGMDIAGMRVYSPEKVPALVENYGIKQIVISDPSLNAAERRRFAKLLGRLPVTTRFLPPIADLTAGKYLVSSLRNVEIDDLLGRSPVPADAELLREVVEGRTIMVTGAGGSIGSELCRAISGWSPKKIILFEVSEFALYQIDRHLRAEAQCEIIPVLGSVLDRGCVEKSMRDYGVDTVYHCAAYKHVPLVERNPFVGVYNNIFGTVCVAEAALATNVDRLVLISSDKAVRPTNVMGATKRWAELIIYHYGQMALETNPNSAFYSVRFGNVLGSNGSVVPLFKEQIAKGGPITLTDEHMTRYFMSIREAAELIIQSGALAESGNTILLEMGEPVNIRDLAENMVLLAGLTVKNAQNPTGDIAIEVVGIRAGEKMFEELFYNPAQVQPTKHPKILRAPSGLKSEVDVPDAMQHLLAALETNDADSLRRVLFDVIRSNAPTKPQQQPDGRD